MTTDERTTGELQSVEIPAEILDGWQGLVDTMAETLRVPAGLIMRVEGEEIEVLVSSRTEENPYEPGDREVLWDSGLYCERVIRSRDRLLVSDARTDPDWCQNPDIELGMVSYLGMPITLPDGRPFGTICVLDSKENRYNETYVRLLGQFRDLAESHLALLSAKQELEARNAELREAMREVHQLREIIPLCMECNRVRNDQGYWDRLESYLRERAGVLVSHAICPECLPAHEEKMFGGTSESQA